MDRRTQLAILASTVLVTVAAMEFGAWIQRKAFRQFEEQAIGSYQCDDCELVAFGTYLELLDWKGDHECR